MNTRQFPRTVVLAAIAAAVMTLAQPAHAGLLGGGGGGGLSGGFGGSLGGMASPRNLSIDGAAAGQGQANQAARLPRADKKAADLASTGAAKASDQAETSRETGAGLLDKGASRSVSAESAAAQRVEAGRNNATSMATTTATATTAPGNTPMTNPSPAAPRDVAAAPTTDAGSARKPSATANASTSGQASRSERSATANAAVDASADGSVRR